MQAGWVPSFRDGAVKQLGLKPTGAVVQDIDPRVKTHHEMPLFFHEAQPDVRPGHDFRKLQRGRCVSTATCSPYGADDTAVGQTQARDHDPWRVAVARRRVRLHGGGHKDGMAVRPVLALRVPRRADVPG